MSETTKRNPDELGGLWIKTGSKGDWMSGTINGQAVVVFRNDRKPEGSNQPDWRVLKARPKTTGGNAEAQFARGPVTDDDVPF